MLYSLHMTPINAKITSKNQLTLPAKLVRKYKIDKNRAVTITENNGVIEIRPQPTLEERMRQAWKKLPAFQGTKTDEDLKQAIRDTYSNKKL